MKPNLLPGGGFVHRNSNDDAKRSSQVPLLFLAVVLACVAGPSCRRGQVSFHALELDAQTVRFAAQLYQAEHGERCPTAVDLEEGEYLDPDFSRSFEFICLPGRADIDVIVRRDRQAVFDAHDGDCLHGYCDIRSVLGFAWAQTDDCEVEWMFPAS